MRGILTLITAITAIAIIGAGCQTHYTKQFQKSESNYGSRVGHERNVKDNTLLYGLAASGTSNGHRNRILRYSNEMSKAVSETQGVFNAIVMVTDQNAYAAVILDWSGTGTSAGGTRSKGDFIGTTRGMYNWRTGNQTPDRNEIATGYNSYYTLDHHRDLSTLFKQRIASKIREVNPRLSEVHISANREFINQMSVYREEERQGVDLNLYLTDFNRLVAKQFSKQSYK